MNKNSLRITFSFAPDRVVAAFLGLLLSPIAIASDPRVQLFDGRDGVTCKYFNAGAAIPWRNALGDWRDAIGQAQGDSPFARADVAPSSDRHSVEWDVTALVRGWADGIYPNSGFLLAPVDGARPVAFASRKADASELRPRLQLEFADAPPKVLRPIADTTVDCSTRRSLGANAELSVGAGARAAIQFDPATVRGQTITKAILEMTALRSAGVTIGVFRIDPPVSAVAAAPAHMGIASAYPRDIGIGRDPAVIMATGFESSSWRADWSQVSEVSHVDQIERDDKGRFAPLIGRALRVEVRQGDNFGLDMTYDFQDKIGYEPEEIYFRYYLRFAQDWDPVVDGGKLPGVAGTYGKAGWGGRRASPAVGWSMRGSFNLAPSIGNPLHGYVTIGTYAYHAAMEDNFGDHWPWINDGLGVLERNRWYCIEQYFKVNTLGLRDGILRAWIDGSLAFEKDDIYVRDLDSIKIEEVWMNVYHGGTAPASYNMHLYIDNVVIAKKPIGCIAP
jgi:hypothetical protein